MLPVDNARIIDISESKDDSEDRTVACDRQYELTEDHTSHISCSFLYCHAFLYPIFRSEPKFYATREMWARCGIEEGIR
jgi:hypothetical protein